MQVKMTSEGLHFKCDTKDNKTRATENKYNKFPEGRTSFSDQEGRCSKSQEDRPGGEGNKTNI